MTIANGGRQILVHGLMLVMVGLVWGLVVPQTPFPRLALTAHAANAWWGRTPMLPIAASQAGATSGAPWQELVIKLTHIGAGLGLIAAWTFLIVGFYKAPAESPTSRARPERTGAVLRPCSSARSIPP